MDHIFSNQRLAADAEKVRAINDMPFPTDAQGVQRLLGLVTYLAKFLPKLSTVCEPLRHLTDKQSQFAGYHTMKMLSPPSKSSLQKPQP